jgi:hypothetical protein
MQDMALPNSQQFLYFETGLRGSGGYCVLLLFWWASVCEFEKSWSYGDLNLL